MTGCRGGGGVAFCAPWWAFLVASSGLLVTTVAATPTASAEEPEALVSITLTGIDPALPQRDGTVTLRGRVTNITDQPLFRLQAIFWRNQAPIEGSDGVQRALASDSNDPIGARAFTTFQDLYELGGDPYLAPQKSAKFTLTAQVSDLELSPTDGIYLMGVHVRQNGQETVGRARVFVPVLDEKPRGSLQMTSIVALSSRPSLVDKGVLADDHLAGEVGSKGRLTALLAAADVEDVSFAVDPALVDELETMAAGYQVLDAEGARPRAAVRPQPRSWLEELDGLLEDHDGFRTLYGSPDVAALVHNKQKSVLTAAARASTEVSATRQLPLLILPTGGMADKATVKALEDLDPAAIVLADESTQPAFPLLAGPGKAPIVVFSATAFGGGPGPDPQNTPVHLQQRLLTDTWIEASSIPKGSAGGRVRLITEPDQAQGDQVDVAAPWITRGPLTELLKTNPVSWNQKFRYSDEARATELTTPQLDRVRALNNSRKAYADLLADSDDVREDTPPLVARAASAAWRGQPAAQEAVVAPQQRRLETILRDGVVISSTPKVSTAAQDGVEFPITIKNVLPRSESDPEDNAVILRLVFISDNAQRLAIADIAPDDPIAAQGNFTANAKVRARANGTIPVRAQLMTKSGIPVGRSVMIDVTVTQNGTVGIAIAVVAGIVLVGTTALRIREVGKERARAAALDAHPSADLRDDPMSSAPPTDLDAGRAADQPTRAGRFDA